MRQGDLYWVELGATSDSTPGYRRPCVIVQNNVFNESLIKTVVVCALTTTTRRAGMRGNVLLKAGEGNLPQQSVVNVTQLITVDRGRLEEYIGALSDERVFEIIAGINLVLEP